jgi:hypothetical protein
MTSLTRFSLIVLLVAALGAGPVLTAFAQGDENPICNGLTAGDCELLESALDRTEAAAAFAMPYWTLNFTLVTEGETIAFEAGGSGAFAEIDGQPAIQLIVEGASISTPDGVASGNTELLILGEMLYLKIEDQWYGSPLDPEQIAPPGGMGDGPLGEAGTLPEIEGLGEALGAGALAFGEAITTTRGPDEDLLGMPVAPFVTTLDVPQMFVGLLALPALQDVLGGALGADGEMFDQLRPEDMLLLLPFIQEMFGESAFTLTQWVGLDDGAIHQVEINAVLDLDAGRLPLDTEDAPPLSASFYLLSGVDARDAVPGLAPPADYLPLSELDESGPLLDA